jgi:hypothetical protein
VVCYSMGAECVLYFRHTPSNEPLDTTRPKGYKPNEADVRGVFCSSNASHGLRLTPRILLGDASGRPCPIPGGWQARGPGGVGAAGGRQHART